MLIRYRLIIITLKRSSIFSKNITTNGTNIKKTNLLILCALKNVIDKTTSNAIVSVKIAVVVIVNIHH